MADFNTVGLLIFVGGFTAGEEATNGCELIAVGLAAAAGSAAWICFLGDNGTSSLSSWPSVIFCFLYKSIHDPLPPEAFTGWFNTIESHQVPDGN